MNPSIKKLYDEISDIDLLKGIEEIINAEKTGIIPDNSVIRTYNFKEMEILGDGDAVLMLTQINFIHQAAIRWYNEKI